MLKDAMLSAADIKHEKLATFRTRKLMEYKGKKTASLGPEKMHGAKDIYL
jgi:hypothetical protein